PAMQGSNRSRRMAPRPRSRRRRRRSARDGAPSSADGGGRRCIFHPPPGRTIATARVGGPGEVQVASRSRTWNRAFRLLHGLIMNTTSRRSALVCLVLACAVHAPIDGQQQSFATIARESLARIEGTISLPGLHAEVEIIRDEWGVPHIYAQNRRDLFFAQGFVQAQDRL